MDEMHSRRSCNAPVRLQHETHYRGKGLSTTYLLRRTKTLSVFNLIEKKGFLKKLKPFRIMPKSKGCAVSSPAARRPVL
jgi:hypothetical protein